MPSERVLLCICRLVQCAVGTDSWSILPRMSCVRWFVFLANILEVGHLLLNWTLRKYAERKWSVRTRRTGASDTFLCRQWWRSSYMIITIENCYSEWMTTDVPCICWLVEMYAVRQVIDWVFRGVGLVLRSFGFWRCIILSFDTSAWEE